jgi:outer membrane protein OmpA-like peptidoglycan-associated protein
MSIVALNAARAGALVLAFAVPTVAVATWTGSAGERIEDEQAAAGSAPAEGKAATASASDVGYCSPDLKRILRRVLQSCGLIGGEGVRGCQPVQARSVATMSGSDFNALFKPMKDRGGIIEFEKAKSDLGAEDTALIDQIFSDQRGASYFFVVARASPEGSVGINRELSKQRAETVMGHLRQTFNDPDLDKEVGLLWLGEEFAQLEQEFCQWRRTGNPDQCKAEQINRSAFIAWIDCTL